jgi:hypothetical protein
MAMLKKVSHEKSVLADENAALHKGACRSHPRVLISRPIQPAFRNTPTLRRRESAPEAPPAPWGGVASASFVAAA